VRYIIDFYRGSPRLAEGQQEAVGMHLDVRPALDSMEAVVDRTKMAWYDVRSSLKSLFKQDK
jgi:cytochrome c heme-lyase